MKAIICHLCVLESLPKDIVHSQKASIIRFRSFHNTVNDCWRFGSMNHIDHLPIFLPNTKSSDCPFAGVIVNRNVSVCEKYPKIFFLIQCISDSTTKFILFGYGYSFQVCKKCIHKRFYNRLPLLKPFFRRKVIQFPFFSIDCLNLFHQQECIRFLL